MGFSNLHRLWYMPATIFRTSTQPFLQSATSSIWAKAFAIFLEDFQFRGRMSDVRMPTLDAVKFPRRDMKEAKSRRGSYWSREKVIFMYGMEAEFVVAWEKEYVEKGADRWNNRRRRS